MNDRPASRGRCAGRVAVEDLGEEKMDGRDRVQDPVAAQSLVATEIIQSGLIQQSGEVLTDLPQCDRQPSDHDVNSRASACDRRIVRERNDAG